MTQRHYFIFLVLLFTMCQAQAADGPGAGDFCGAEPASEAVVDFSTKTARIKALGAKVSMDKSLTVLFPKAGTGVMLSAPKGKWDLSKFVALAIDVTNLSDKPVTLMGRLNSHQWINSFLHLPANTSETMVIHLMRLKVEDERAQQFTGMRGVPGGHIWHWVPFDPSTVKSLTIRDLDGVSVGQSIRITAVRAVGRYAPLPNAKSFFPFVDNFGQFKHRDWPGKIMDHTGFQKAIVQETIDLSSHPGPGGWGKYGGWLQGPKFKATGHFRTKKHEGKWWLVDPDGYLFWSHGIDGVQFKAATGVHKRKYYFEKAPVKDGRVDFAQLNLQLKYGDTWQEQARNQAHLRVKSWGMNTLGNWSDEAVYGQGKTPYVVAVHFGGARKDPGELRKNIQARLEKEAKKNGNDPWCIGYFVDNELNWGAVMAPEQYYKIISEEMKRAVPNKLYLGSRLHAHNSPWGGKKQAVVAAAKYCDVVGVNRYRFSLADLKMLDGIDVPLLIGEFHFGAMDRGMLHTGLRGIANQRQRAYAYEHYVTQALKHPNIVGTHWFIFRDQSLTGRRDGENYQVGFVDVCDTPYPEIRAASRKVGYHLYQRRLEAK